MGNDAGQVMNDLYVLPSRMEDLQYVFVRMNSVSTVTNSSPRISSQNAASSSVVEMTSIEMVPPAEMDVKGRPVAEGNMRRSRLPVKSPGHPRTRAGGVKP